VRAGFIDIPSAMYKKGVAVEIQFSPERLNDGAGDPYWIDLTAEEAQRLLKSLQAQLAAGSVGRSAPLVLSLDDTQGEPSTDVSASTEADTSSADDFKQWVCVICGWIYDEAAG
jgi:hypothetical protein